VEFGIIGLDSGSSFSQQKPKRQLSVSSQTENSQGKTKFTKLIKGLEKFYFEPDAREETSLDQ